MQLYYFRDPNLNFGDDLNPWIWSKLLPDFFDDDASTLFVGIGTLLNHRIPSAKHRIVFGSGYGYGEKPHLDDSWNIVCVRGPMTALELSLPSDSAAIDPAVFINELFPFRAQQKIYPVSFMPHCTSAAQGDWALVCQIAGIHYIDPRQDVEKIMTELAASELLLAEAMHGAIAAEAFRVPWIALNCYNHISAFKWQDWCSSIQLAYDPQTVPSLYCGDGLESINVRTKNIVKRALHSRQVWSSSWQPPPPIRSTVAEHQHVADILIEISKNTQPCQTSDSLFEQRMEQINGLLQRLKNTK